MAPTRHEPLPPARRAASANKAILACVLGAQPSTTYLAKSKKRLIGAFIAKAAAQMRQQSNVRQHLASALCPQSI
eukprot:scaffold141301_cov30-Tisochrysis_lutea.AAC.6